MNQVLCTGADRCGLLRDFWRGAKYGTSIDLMDAALCDEEPEAALLVEFCAQMSVNRRTRRSMKTLAEAHRHSPWPRWYGVFARHVYTMWHFCRRMALPEEKVVGPQVAASRGMRGLLSHAGLAMDQLPPLAPQAHAITMAIWRSMEPKQVGVVYDNLYPKRYCSDPVQPDCHLNVTPMSVVHTTDIAMYPGSPTLDDLLRCIPETIQARASTYREFQRAVEALRRDSLAEKYTLVPLDVHRDNIRSLQWYPLKMFDLVSTSNENLLHIMEKCLAMKVHTRHVMPLLIDVNIFYILAKFL